MQLFPGWSTRATFTPCTKGATHCTQGPIARLHFPDSYSSCVVAGKVEGVTRLLAAGGERGQLHPNPTDGSGGSPGAVMCAARMVTSPSQLLIKRRTACPVSNEWIGLEFRKMWWERSASPSLQAWPPPAKLRHTAPRHSRSTR